MFDRLVDILVQFIDLFKFWIILEPYEAGVQTRLGIFVRVLDPGLHWLYPFRIDHVMFESVVPTTHSLGNESITTKDGKSLGFHSVVTYRVRDIQKAMLEVADTDHALRDSCAGEIGRILREHTMDEIMSGVATDNVTAACRKRGWRFGIEVMSVQFAGLCVVKNIRLMQNG